MKNTGQSENTNQSYSGIQECTSSKCIPVCAIGCFEFSLPTGKNCLDACAACFTVFGGVFGTLFLIGVGLLGCSSSEFDTTQGNG